LIADFGRDASVVERGIVLRVDRERPFMDWNRVDENGSWRRG